MRVAQVLTYVSTDAAYGGPLAVATAHCRELASRGHDVELFAGWDGEASLEIPGVAVRFFKVRRLLPHGFAGLLAPRLPISLASRAGEFDVVHVHLGRDLVTLPAALLVVLRHRRRPRVFVQTHGMIGPDARLSARVVDLAVRPVLHGARTVLALHLSERDRVRAVAGSTVRVEELPNGVPAQETHHRATPETCEFVFLARLHPRKRVMLFAEAARMVHEAGACARFRVVGPDEGDLAKLKEFIVRHRLDGVLEYEGSIGPGAGPSRLSRSDVFVLPSSREPFPMTVLEALSVGVPSVVSSDCQIAAKLVAAGGVVTFAGGAPELAAVLADLARDPSRRSVLAAQALDAVSTTFGINAVVDRLEQLYGADDAGPPS